jgi:uncharacterized membrane protein YkoI
MGAGNRAPTIRRTRVKQSTQKWLACAGAAAMLNLAGCAMFGGQEDLPASEIARMQSAGEVLPFSRLNAGVIARHPGSAVVHAALDKIGDRFLYQARLEDSNKLQWFVELDAKNGEVVTDKEDPS